MSIDKKSTYYDAGGIETIDVITAKLSNEQMSGYLLGNLMKYSMRMMHKTPRNPLRDAQKAQTYSELLCRHITVTKSSGSCVKANRSDVIENIHNIRKSINRLKRVIDPDVGIYARELTDLIVLLRQMLAYTQ